VILDLKRFIETERPLWQELEKQLQYLEDDPAPHLEVEQVKRLHYLYERSASDLAKVQADASNAELNQYLQTLVARAYCEIHETNERRTRFRPIHWFFVTFPQTFRRNIRFFWVAVLATLLGGVFGGLFVVVKPESKQVLIPGTFGHLYQTPTERVAEEESGGRNHLDGQQAGFAAGLMVNNIRVSLTAMAMGLTYGLITLIVLFYNGVILGVVVVDYIGDGQSVFLAGWLLPHGSVEIPAILIGGMAGLMIGHALIGWGDRQPVGRRLRAIVPDLVTLCGGLAIMLIWAGIIESYFSQYHITVMPYAQKIWFGVAQLVLLIIFLWRSGTREKKPEVAG
jgi:uncharacterized membrane protein SpoIIM required for sporulation